MGLSKSQTPELIQKLLVAYRLEQRYATQVPYTKSDYLSRTRPGEELADRPASQCDVGVLRLVADTINPTIAWIFGMLGRQQHNPAKRHSDAIKLMLQYLNARLDDGPVYKPSLPLTIT